MRLYAIESKHCWVAGSRRQHPSASEQGEKIREEKKEKKDGGRKESNAQYTNSQVVSASGGSPKLGFPKASVLYAVAVVAVAWDPSREMTRLMRAPSAEICSENDGRALLTLTPVVTLLVTLLTVLLTLLTLLRGGTTDAMMSPSTFRVFALWRPTRTRRCGCGLRGVREEYVCVDALVLTDRDGDCDTFSSNSGSVGKVAAALYTRKTLGGT